MKITEIILRKKEEGSDVRVMSITTEEGTTEHFDIDSGRLIKLYGDIDRSLD